MAVRRGPTDTIIALASGAGRAGIAVIRVSGSAAPALLRQLSAQDPGVSRETPLPAPRQAAIRSLHDSDGAFLDEALVLWMPGPNSYTGEDTVEFHVHGGPAVIAAVLDAALRTGLCRVAEPGEFTRRAFDAGRM
jgi:tRNA modification GTPase